MSLKLNSSGGGSVLLQEPSTASNRTLTLPDADGTVIYSDASANLQFNSGYGSIATAYGCRAWVNFNGTGTVAIRASGNVSSITDNGTGDYTVNFTTAMPDANYAVSANNSPNFAGAFSCGAGLFSNGTPTETAPTTSAARIFFGNTSGSAYDPKYVCVSIFR
jgi:uncharacterized protein (AIM24 family)